VPLGWEAWMDPCIRSRGRRRPLPRGAIWRRPRAPRRQGSQRCCLQLHILTVELRIAACFQDARCTARSSAIARFLGWRALAPPFCNATRSSCAAFFPPSQAKLRHSWDIARGRRVSTVTFAEEAEPAAQ